MLKTIHPTIRLSFAISYTLFLFILVSLPSKQLSSVDTINDKVAHFAVFLVLTLVWLWFKKKEALIVLLCILFGIFIEIWQDNLPTSFHRSLDWYDAVADALGVITGWVISKIPFVSNKIE